MQFVDVMKIINILSAMLYGCKHISSEVTQKSVVAVWSCVVGQLMATTTVLETYIVVASSLLLLRSAALHESHDFVGVALSVGFCI